MTKESVFERLIALPTMIGMPREELGWLVEHGEVEVHKPASVVLAKGERVEKLYVLLSGQIATHHDQGAGPRRVTGWRTGEVTGMLPFSRMTETTGVTVAEEATEFLAVHVGSFPEMFVRCPTFTAHTVHVTVDRARTCNTSALQDEKMVSLGRLAAGLAHELNNPASAAARSAKQLLESTSDAEAASRALGAADLTSEQITRITALRASCQARAGVEVMSPMALAMQEDAIADWLLRHDLDESHAVPLADTAIALEELDALASSITGDTGHGAGLDRFGLCGALPSQGHRERYDPPSRSRVCGQELHVHG